MMATSLQLPHEKDFAPNAKLCGYLTENAVALEQEDHDDDQALSDEIVARKNADALETQERKADDIEEIDQRRMYDEAEEQERKNADAKEASDRTSGDYKLQMQINDAINRISSLEQRVTDTEVGISKLEVGISKLNDRCDKLENLIKLLDSQLNSGMPLDNWLDKAKEGEDFDDLINEIE